MSYGDFRRVVKRERPGPAVPNRLRSALVLLVMAVVLAGIIWLGFRPFLP